MEEINHLDLKIVDSLMTKENKFIKMTVAEMTIVQEEEIEEVIDRTYSEEILIDQIGHKESNKREVQRELTEI